MLQGIIHINYETRRNECFFQTRSREGGNERQYSYISLPSDTVAFHTNRGRTAVHAFLGPEIRKIRRGGRVVRRSVVPVATWRRNKYTVPSNGKQLFSMHNTKSKVKNKNKKK